MRHQGGCHCGKVRFEVELDLDQVIACNCSICTRKGLTWSFTARDRFALTSGAGDLAEYRFHTHQIAHHFCRTCGTEPFALGEAPGGGGPTAAINVRCLDGVDLQALETVDFDGARLL